MRHGSLPRLFWNEGSANRRAPLALVPFLPQLCIPAWLVSSPPHPAPKTKHKLVNQLFSTGVPGARPRQERSAGLPRGRERGGSKALRVPSYASIGPALRSGTNPALLQRYRQAVCTSGSGAGPAQAAMPVTGHRCARQLCRLYAGSTWLAQDPACQGACQGRAVSITGQSGGW